MSEIEQAIADQKIATRMRAWLQDAFMAGIKHGRGQRLGPHDDFGDFLANAMRNRGES